MRRQSKKVRSQSAQLRIESLPEKRGPRRAPPQSAIRLISGDRSTSPKENIKAPSIGVRDTQTDMLPGGPKSAICVQKFDDSLISAIHITYRSWLRSSSMHEPRDPPLKVVYQFIWIVFKVRSHNRLASACGKQNQKRAYIISCFGQTKLRLISWLVFLVKKYKGSYISHSGLIKGFLDLLMILPQVHLRKPCYDFYFL